MSLPSFLPEIIRSWERAEASVARLDQALRLSPVTEPYLALARLHEAVRSAQLEGLGTTVEAVLQFRLDPAAAGQDRASRTAIDILDALEAAERRGRTAALTADGVAEAAGLSSRFGLGTAVPPTEWVWQAEDWLEAGRGFADWPGLLAVAAAVRLLAGGAGFGEGTGRLARIMVPFLLERAGKTARAGLFLSERLARRGLSLELLAAGPEALFAQQFLEALADAADEGERRLATLALLRGTLHRRCPGRRSTSSLGRAVDLILGMPLVSARALQERLGLSLRGAHLLVDQLVAARVLVETTGRSRDRLFLAPEVAAW